MRQEATGAALGPTQKRFATVRCTRNFRAGFFRFEKFEGFMKKTNKIETALSGAASTDEQDRRMQQMKKNRSAAMRELLDQALSDEARRLFDKIGREWAIKDQSGKLLLATAETCYLEMRQAQQILALEGAIVKDRFGTAKLHPGCQREKEARAHLLACLKSLNLDLETLEETDDAEKA